MVNGAGWGLAAILALSVTAAARGDAGLELELAPQLSAPARAALRQRLDRIERTPRFDLVAPVAGADALAERLLAWAAGREIDADVKVHARLAALVAALPDWPDRLALQRKAEQVMPPGGDAAARVAWFDAHPPVTGLGRLRLGEALMTLGREAEAVAQLRAGWRSAWSEAAEEKRLLKAYGAWLRPEDHAARFAFLLEWRGYTAARRMLRLLAKDQRLLAEARLALRSFAGDVDARVAAVPAALKQDAGLVLDRAYWRRQKNLDEAARAMLAQPIDPMTLQRPEEWWRERHVHARALLREGKPAAAYAMAAGHGLRPTADGNARSDRVRMAYAEAEWLAGWIALRFTDQPARAQEHFARLYDAVTTATSRSRAAYWLGRAALALGDQAAAQTWFARAADDRQRYYGQLAAERLGEGVGPPPAPAVVVTAQARDAFLAREDV
ncbi:MAG: hypothetical protein D6782_09995, partial [Alphaproteobacteria bacterium]